MHKTLLLVLGLAIAVAGCEEHPRRVAQGGPEYMHEALGGDAEAQARLAACLEADGKCLDTPADPAMACAWRGVRLASRSPTLSLADVEARRAACASSDETFRQRAAIAQEQYIRSIYRRAPAPAAEPPTDKLLYPSVEAVRQRVNGALGAANLPRLPAFAVPAADQGRLAWKACAATVCLEASSPEFGGGLFSYKVAVTGASDGARVLAARLVAAGLDASAVSGPLASASEAGPGMDAGGVCWTVGRGDAGAVAAARLGPCRDRG